VEALERFSVFFFKMNIVDIHDFGTAFKIIVDVEILV